MQLLSNSVLAFAILSCSLLSTTLAAPTPQIFPLGGDDGQTSVESRGCHSSRCIGSPDDQLSSTARQMRSSNSVSANHGSQLAGDILIADARGSNAQSRQTHNGQMASEGDIETRQLMHAMGTEEGDTQSRQVHGGLMAEDGQSVEGRQVMHSSSDKDGVLAVESRQIGFGPGEENGDVRGRQVMHSSSADQGIVSRPVGPNREEGEVLVREFTYSGEDGKVVDWHVVNLE